MGMTPYFDDGQIQIWNADCRDILPTIAPGSVDLVLTDPPYGMDYKPLRGADGSKRWIEGVEGDDEPFDPAILLPFGRCVLFGANWYADRLPNSGGWIVWDKTPLGIKEGFNYSHAELAWTNITGSIAKFSLQWGGEARNKEPYLHPTQKPVALMRWLVEKFTKPDDLVLDPYMGSGPIADACRQTGRRYIGIERKEIYCRAAIGRLQQSVLPLTA
jgi:site-specific DNA-methyltransferase (adenine-specific)